MEFVDVAIVGGGLMGAATAWALGRRPTPGRDATSGGHGRPRVTLFEALEPAHERGSSHGDGRIVRFTYAEAVYLEMARRVYPLWAELERESGTELLVTTGSWECGRRDSEILAELEAGLEGADVPFERLDADESRRRFPHFTLPPDGVCLYQADGAVVRAAEAVRALWRRAEAAGVGMRRGRRVTHLEPGDGGVEIRAVDAEGREKRLRAGSVVITGGGWAGPLLAGLGLELPLEACRETLAYFPLRASAPLDIRAGRMPTVIDYFEDLPFYALPQMEVPGVKVGWHHSGPEVELPPPGPGSPREAEAEPRILERLRAFVAERMPHLGTEPTRALTCLYTNTPDYHFVLGHHPREPRIVFGTGFSGHGFKFGPIVGEILASLALGEAPAIDITPFHHSRLASSTARRKGA